MLTTLFDKPQPSYHLHINPHMQPFYNYQMNSVKINWYAVGIFVILILMVNKQMIRQGLKKFDKYESRTVLKYTASNSNFCRPML